MRELLLARAAAWGRAAGGGVPPLHCGSVAEVAPALAGWEGPIALLAPDVPAVGPGHLAAALDDLAAGVDLSAAAATDGRPFLIVLSRPDPELMRIATLPFDDMLVAARARGGPLGMLRHERRLASLGDARALVVDPLAPAQLRALLKPFVDGETTCAATSP
jgi:hypothetical protein